MKKLRLKERLSWDSDSKPSQTTLVTVYLVTIYLEGFTGKLYGYLITFFLPCYLGWGLVSFKKKKSILLNLKLIWLSSTMEKYGTLTALSNTCWIKPQIAFWRKPLGELAFYSSISPYEPSQPSSGVNFISQLFNHIDLYLTDTAYLLSTALTKFERIFMETVQPIQVKFFSVSA